MRFSPVCSLLCLVLISCIAAKKTQSDATLTRKTQSKANLVSVGTRSETFLVSLLDGQVVAVDSQNGKVLWRFHSGSPLVSAHQPGDDTKPMAIFPGVDGSLYVFHELPQRLEKQPYTLPQLVESSPSWTKDGSLILGQRHSSVYLVDASTGELLQVFTDYQDALAEHNSGLGAISAVDKNADVLFIGRQDFIVRSINAASNTEAWNASYSRMQILRPSTAQGPSSIREYLRGEDSFVVSDGAKLHGGAPLPRLAVGPDNTLHAFDPSGEFGKRKWVLKLATPPVAAYSKAGTVNHLALAEQQPQLPPGQGPLSIVSAPSELGRKRQGTNVLVGKLQGSYYALPADNILLDMGEMEEDWPVLALDVPADSVAGGESTNAPGGSAGGALVPLGVGLTQGAGRGHSGGGGSEGAGGFGAADVCLPPVLHVVHTRGPAALPWLPEDLEAGGVKVQQPQKERYASVASLLSPATMPASLAAVALVLLAVVGAMALALAMFAGMVALRRVAPTASAIVAAPPLPMAVVEPLAASAKHAGELSVTASAATLSPAPLAKSTPPRRPARKGKATKQARAASAEPPLASISTKAEAPSLAAQMAALSPAGGTAARALPPAPGRPGPVADPRAGATAPSPAPPPSGASSDRQTGGWGQVGEDLAIASPVSAEAVEAAQGRLGGAQSPALQPSLQPPARGGSGAMSLPEDGPSTRNSDGSVRVGQLLVGPGVLGYGSAGTIVYEGVLNGRPVAVKRLLRQFYDIAQRELEMLIVSDEHPNVVRCFAMHSDSEFVYVALERCTMTLGDLVAGPDGPATLLAQDGTPGLAALQLAGEVAAGLAALHARGIVHRDVKPQNVLLTAARRAKLSDMGLSKQLISEQSSFESHGSGGSSGWQAPEQLIVKDGGAARQSRATDVFSLGCLVFYVLTAGRHPFGESYERDGNILRGRAANLRLLAASPAALNLVAAMVQKAAPRRPTMAAVQGHPAWWDPERTLQFLLDVSDRVENEDREPDPALLCALETVAPAALGGNWGVAVDAELVANLGRYRRYDFNSLRDLLRVIRNKRNHFREMPETLQTSMGPLPEGYLRYFSSRFPNLLLCVYFFALQSLPNDINLSKYWPSGADAYTPFFKAFQTALSQQTRAAAAALVAATAAGTKAIPAAQGSAIAAAVSRACAARDAAAAGGEDDAAGPAGGASDGAGRTSSGESGVPGPGAGPGSGSSSAGLVVGYEPDVAAEAETHVLLLPRRSGKPACEFFTKTGFCKYSSECVYDHPQEYAVELTEGRLPLRPGQPVCAFYLRTAACKFGPACKFNHPPLRPLLAGSATAVAPSGGP